MMTKERRGDLTGQRFGHLVVLGRSDDLIISGRNESAWLCLCDCGDQKVMPGRGLIQGRTQSCGCIKRKPEYRSWNHMLSRCLNPNNHKYKSYGARGITVCERWRIFDNFYADMGPQPGDGYSIDRIDNDGNYEPGNCRWSTRQEQMINTRRNILVEYQGSTYTITALAKHVGINDETLRSRIHAGVPVEQAIQRTKIKRLAGGSPVNQAKVKSEADLMDADLEAIRSGALPIVQMTDELLEEIENSLF